MPAFLGSELLQGDRVRLTRSTRDDIAVIAGWSSDMGYQRLLRRGMVYPGSVEEHEHWFESMAKSDDYCPFSIRTLDADRLVGLIVIKDIVWQARHCAFFIGIGDAAMRGQGYGSDAVRVLLKYVFLEMNLNRVGLEVLDYNAAAMRAYENVGFRHEGTLRAYAYRDGVYYDMHLMGMLRSEWEARYGYPAVHYPAAAIS